MSANIKTESERRRAMGKRVSTNTRTENRTRGAKVDAKRKAVNTHSNHQHDAHWNCGQ